MTRLNQLISSRRIRWFYVLSIVFSAGGILFIISRANPEAVGETMQKVSPGYFVLSTLIVIGIQVLLAIRWRVLLGYRLPLRHSVTASFVGLAVNAVTPLRLGEIIRAALARRSAQIPLSESIPSIVLGQLLDLLTLTLIGLVLLVTVPLSPQLVNATMVVGGIAAVSLVVLYIITHTSDTQRQRVKSILTRHFGDRGTRFIRGIVSRIQVGLGILNNRRQFVFALSLSLLFWSTLALANWLLLPTLIESPSIWMGVTLAFASGLGRTVPALPGDIGTLDLIVMLSLVLLGVPEEVAITVALSIRIRYIIMVIVIGALGIGGAGVSLAKIRQLAREAQTP